jgi:hypothetical protein
MGVTAAPPSRRIAAALFAAVFLATGGAFFVTQRLKRSTPIVGRVFFQQWFSPNGDGRRDTVQLRFDLPRAQRVTVSLLDSRDEVVRTLVDDVYMTKGRHRFIWNGRDDAGHVVPDGVYHLRVGLRDEGRSVTSPRDLYVATKPPQPRIVDVTPHMLVPATSGTIGQVQIRFTGPTRTPPTIEIWRTDTSKITRVVSFLGQRGAQSATWDGLIGGAPAPEGTYAISVTVQDRAGNRGSAPPVLPPVRAFAAPRSGVTVSYLSLGGSLLPVEPGGTARFTVGPVPRPVRWRLALVGHGGAIREGLSHGTQLAVPIPRDARRGIYSVQIRAGGRRAYWPVVVGGRGRGRGHAAGLVVVPATTWQGQNAVDSNNDGFPDTLDAGDAVPLERPFAQGRFPPEIGSQTVPLLDYLDHVRANYDLTTDADLMRDGGLTPADLGAYRGVVFAGSQRWMTKDVAVLMRRFALRGGKVLSFGVDAFRRRVTYAGGVLTRPTRPARSNIFGERTTPFTGPPAPLVVTLNTLGLFSSTDGLIGNFTSFERSDKLGRATAILAGAGRDGKADLVAYRLGRGLVIRSDTDQWGGQLGSSAEVASITRRMWDLISR